MAWGTTPLWRKTAQTPDTQHRMNFVFVSGVAGYTLTPQHRNDVIERWEATGLNAATGQTQAAANGGAIVDRARMDESGQWRVVEEKRTEGAWADDT